MDNKKYLLDGEPASAMDLIHAAEKCDGDFAMEGIKQASWAAIILRQHGRTVENNKEE